jgi:hypothetical protein
MKLYNSIEEMPVYNWFKCIDLKDYSYCAIDKNAIDLEKCKECFSNLYNEFLDTFGINESLKQVIELQNEITILKIDKVLTENNSLQTFIELKQIELDELINVKTEKTKTYKVEIEKFLGFRINEKEVSVKEYYEYLEALKENGRATD